MRLEQGKRDRLWRWGWGWDLWERAEGDGAVSEGQDWGLLRCRGARGSGLVAGWLRDCPGDRESRTRRESVGGEGGGLVGGLEGGQGEGTTLRLREPVGAAK